MVAAVAVFLQTHTINFSTENTELVQKILQTLIEMCVGNTTNQLVILDHHVIDSINTLLQADVTIPQCAHESFDTVSYQGISQHQWIGIILASYAQQIDKTAFNDCL